MHDPFLPFYVSISSTESDFPWAERLPDVNGSIVCPELGSDGSCVGVNLECLCRSQWDQVKPRPAFDPWLSAKKGSQDNCAYTEVIKVPLFLIPGAGNLLFIWIAQKVLFNKKEEINFIDHIHIPSMWWKKSLPILLIPSHLSCSDTNFCYTFFYSWVLGLWQRNSSMACLWQRSALMNSPVGISLLPLHGLTSWGCLADS